MIQHPNGPVPNAAAVGYALLDRARADGACAPQENLALLVAADQVIREVPAEQELQQAALVCPGDPTPLWLEGQFEAQQAIVNFGSFIGPTTGPEASAGYRLAQPFVTFRRLEQAFPRSAAGWAGEADSEMRIGYQIEALQPFSARLRFARAVALYRRGEALAPGPDMLQGEAGRSPRWVKYRTPRCSSDVPSRRPTGRTSSSRGCSKISNGCIGSRRPRAWPSG